MKKRLLALVLAALMVVSSGCGRKQEMNEYIDDHYQRVTQPQAQAGETEPSGTTAGEEIQPQAFEDMQWIYKTDGKGSVICTITNVRAVKNDRDFDGNCFTEDGALAFHNPEYDKERIREDPEKYSAMRFLHYPDSVDGSGDLLDGYLILVDLTLENIDARNEYLNHQTGEMVPRDGDPYIFRAMQFIFLQNRSVPEYTPCKNAEYYSGLNDLEIHPMAFRLEPGETASIQIGFLTNEAPYTWSLEDDLILNTMQNGSLDGIWFPLDLEAPEA